MRLPAARPGWSREFTLLWAGSATSQLGTISAATASPLLALALDGSAVFAGWVAAASTLPGLLLNLPAGLIADHIPGKRQLMMASQIIRLCNALILLLALFCSDNPQLFLIVAAAVDGICASFYNITEITAIREIIPKDHLSSAMAKNEARHHIALVFGRPLGGFLYGVNHTLPYFFDALTSLLALVNLGMLRDSEKTTTISARPEFRIGPKKKKIIGPQLPTSWQLFKGDFFLRYVIAVCAGANFLFQVIILLLIVRAQGQGYSSAQIGLLLAASGISGLAGALIAPHVMRGRSPQLAAFTCFCVWAVLVWCVWSADQAWVGLVAWGTCSFLGAHVNIALAMYQATRVPKEVLGRVASLTKFLTSGAVPLGALCAGYAIDLLGTGTTALLAAMAMSIMMVLMSRRLLVDRQLSLSRGPLSKLVTESGQVAVFSSEPPPRRDQ